MITQNAPRWHDLAAGTRDRHGLFITVPARRLAQIDRGTDADGRPAMMLKFDDAGTQRLRQLTKANDGRLLAEIVYGVVVSTPTIRAGQNGLSSVVVSGIFQRAATR